MIQWMTGFLEWLGMRCPVTPETWMDRTACAFAEPGAIAVAPLFLGALLIGTLIAVVVRRRGQRDLQTTEAFLYPGTAPAIRRPAAPKTTSELDGRSVRSRTPAPESVSPREPAPGGNGPVPDASDPVASSVTSVSPDVEPPTGAAPEGTLQLLPGRLEASNGAAGRKEIRFVRVPGTAPEISFGRTEGPPHRHVQLSSPTVSRRHARMRFDGARWLLVNESTTNPTRLNGRTLDAAEGETALGDGDRLEMGEVELVFRQEGLHDRLPLRSSWHTDRGRRPNNQDAVAVRTLRDGRELAVVCDGMGGHAAGAVASHTALEAFVNLLEDGGDLRDAVMTANHAVRTEAAKDPGREGMGTTLVALLRDGDAYWVSNVGDSRAYRIDAEGLGRITEDHSFVSEVVRDGRMSSEEAERSPWRNALTRHLGADDDVEVDIYGPYETNDDHIVLLCSDGVHGTLSERALEELVLASADVRDLAREAAEAALRGGGDDNVAAAALQFGQRVAAAAHADDTG